MVYISYGKKEGRGEKSIVSMKFSCFADKENSGSCLLGIGVEN